VEAIILAGGKAERLGDAAGGRPKALVEVAGRPLAAYQVGRLVRAGVEATGAASPRDMGRVIKHVMQAAGGRADGKRVSTKVKEALS